MLTVRKFQGVVHKTQIDLFLSSNESSEVDGCAVKVEILGDIAISK
jgi:hypothetical protein